MPPKILIEVSGGIVQRVASDTKTDVYLIDHDNLEAGDSPDEVGKPYVADLVKDIEKEVERALKPYRK